MITPGTFVISLVREIVKYFDDALASAALTVGVALIFVGYPVLCETFLSGRSVGKRALGLRVIREDGSLSRELVLDPTCVQ